MIFYAYYIYFVYVTLTMKDGGVDIIIQKFMCAQKTSSKLRLYFGLRHQPVVED